MKPFKRQW